MDSAGPEAGPGGVAVCLPEAGSHGSDAAESPAPESTALDGRYVLGAEVGGGGMATVYRARDTVLDRTVAVKVFAPYAALPDGDARRAAEVRLLAGLNHPGLVMVYDAGSASDAGGPFDYLVMEFVAGTTLARAIAGGPLPPAEVAHIGAQLAAGLGYVHERGIVHRDVKPANVLLSEGSAGTIAKLADFGVARLVDSTRLTVHGTTLGTPNYLSPEQATGEPVTPASDIYSLGLVLLEALTGERAFPGLGIEAVVQRLHRQPDIPAKLDAGWTALLSAMTAVAPGKRPDAHAVQTYLEHFANPTRATLLGASLARPGRTTMRGKVARRWGWVWPVGGTAATAGAAAVLCALLLGGRNAPAATFDTVSGPLGADLTLLETVAPPQLHDDLVALSQAAASGQRSAARHDLAVLAADLRAMHRSGTVGGQRYWETRTAIAAVLADLGPGAHATAPASLSDNHPSGHSAGARATPSAPTRSYDAARTHRQTAREGTARTAPTQPVAPQTHAAPVTRNAPVPVSAQSWPGGHSHDHGHGHGHDHGHGFGHDHGHHGDEG